MEEEIKFLRRPVDTLRLGLGAARDVGASTTKHPVAVMQEEGLTFTIWTTQRASGVAYRKTLETMALTHGTAVAAKLDIERQILSNVERLPGQVPSKRLGLSIVTGEIDRFGFEDYLGQPGMREDAPRLDTHMIMEEKLKLGPGVGRF